jgi:hypothetical protein
MNMALAKQHPRLRYVASVFSGNAREWRFPSSDAPVGNPTQAAFPRGLGDVQLGCRASSNQHSTFFGRGGER